MAKLVSVFISRTHRRLIGLLVWVVCFAAILGLSGSYALHKTSVAMAERSRVATEQFVTLRTNLLAALDAMHQELTADPCTPAFADQLRKIAYRPDGLNEFLYAPGGRVLCSTGRERFEPGIDLGEPDMSGQGTQKLSFWMDRDLGFLGLGDARGTIVMREPYAAIVPKLGGGPFPSDWLSAEIVLVAADGSWSHRGGEFGIRGEALAAGDGLILTQARVYRSFCDGKGMHCLALRADLFRLAASNKGKLAVVLIFSVLIASFVALIANQLLTKHWSFEARFRRYFDQRSVVCHYQPVMALNSGEITGCEVLARWRDIDDRLVYPDSFIDIVLNHRMTLRFTEMVARQAFEELSAALPAERRIQVNFNIFPCDLDSARLAQVFSGFISKPDRFDLVLEIIESDEIPDNAQSEIEALRGLGVRTFIDDFGTGYSNMQNLAALSVDGVKLDRAFAMAPDDSMMAQMLRHAIEMIHATGRVMVVEGVETAERLALLRCLQSRVDYVQGYFISRPLDIDEFIAFLQEGRGVGVGMPAAYPVRSAVQAA